MSPQGENSPPSLPGNPCAALLPAVSTLLGLLLFFFLGLGFYHQALRPRLPPGHVASLPGDREVILLGQLDHPCRVRPEGVRLSVAVAAWKGPGGWRRACGRVLVFAPPLAPPPRGTPVVLRGKLREPEALRNPGAWERRRYLASQGIFRELHLTDPGRLIFLVPPAGPSLAERLRGRIREHLKALSPEGEAIFLSMLLGDQGKVTPKMRQDLSRTGTSHLLVINGLHLGAVATVTFFVVFNLLRIFPRLLLRLNALKLATLAAALPVVAYAHLAGGSPSTQRAEIMVLTYLVLMFLGRGRDVLNALGLAALIILMLSPLLLFSVSFQLSFAAVAGILFLYPRFRPRTPEPSLSAPRGSGGRKPVWIVCRRLWELLAVSLAASLATAPLVAHHFQVVSLLGFLVNLAAVPLVLFVALPLGEMAILAQALGLTQVSAGLLQLAHHPVRLGYDLISRAAALPGSGLAVPALSWLQVALLYLLLAGLFLSHLSRWSWAAGAIAGVILGFTFLPPGNRDLPTAELVVLDSPVGLEAVVISPQRHHLVVTAPFEVWPGWEGGSPGALPDYLRWRQVRRLDLVLALGLNPRNAPGLLTLAQQFSLGQIRWEGRRPEGKTVELLNFLGDQGIPIQPLGEPQDRQRPSWAPSAGSGWTLEYLPAGEVLKITMAGHELLLLPPAKRKVLEVWDSWRDLKPEVVVAPGEWEQELERKWPEVVLLLYGRKKTAAGFSSMSRPRRYHTRDGAVTVTISNQGVTCSQYHP